MSFAAYKFRILWTVIIILLLAVSIASKPRQIIFDGHIFSAVDEAATDYVGDGLTRATSAFAMARTFNAIVSVFRESQLQLEPGGIGVSVAVGAALDPLNDLVERFSWVMLASMTSLGIQGFLIKIVPFVCVRVLLLLALFSFLAGLWLSNRFQFDFLKAGKILLFMTILLRFAVPAMAYLNNQVYVLFLENEQNASVAALGSTVKKLKEQEISEVTLNPQQTESLIEEQSWLDKTKMVFNNAIDQGKEIIDIRAKLDYIKNISAQLIDHIVDLIVIFVVNTIFLPILFLWGFLRLGRLFISRGFGLAAEEWLLRKIGEKS